MAKRLTATEKWQDPWFCNLSIVDRLFWIYLTDNCDHAGIWQVNKMLVTTYFPGYALNPETFGDRIAILNPEKWLLTKFVSFQYGSLNPANRVHRSVLMHLEKEGATKGLTRGLLAPKDKDKDKDKDKAKDKDREGCREGSKDQRDWFEKLWNEYPAKGRMRKREALKRFTTSVPDVETAHRCVAALERYIESKRVKEGYIQNAPTWFGDWQSWEHYSEDKN